MERGKLFWYFPRVLALILALVGTSSFLIYSDIIARVFQSVAKLETDPSYTGGRIAAVMYDPVGDDHGFGGLAYPLHREFASGSLDLVRYTVHEPVYSARWSNLAEYWQLDLAFTSGPQSVRNIRIYLDVDGDGKGARIPRDEMAEGVSFDPASPWDFVVAAQGSGGVLESSDGKYSVPLEVSLGDGGKKVTIRIPLGDRALHGLYTAKETRHYVCVGGWTPWGRDGYLPIAKRAAQGSGGGASSSLTPKIYDYLASSDMTQEELLSAWNDDTLTIPVLYPVAVSMRSELHAASAVKASSERVSALEKAAAEEMEASKGEALAALEDGHGRYDEKESASLDALSPYDMALLLFNAGKRDEAEVAFDRILAKNDGDSSAFAYKGALVAMRGGDASPLAAVGIIAEAYVFLDKAVLAAKTSDERLTSLISRASVSRAIPDTVFGKALQGAGDYLAVAGEYRNLAGIAADPSVAYLAEIADAYFNAALCYEILGRQDESGTWFRESARIVGTADTAPVPVRIPSSLALELVKRGYLE